MLWTPALIRESEEQFTIRRKEESMEAHVVCPLIIRISLVNREAILVLAYLLHSNHRAMEVRKKQYKSPYDGYNTIATEGKAK